MGTITNIIEAIRRIGSSSQRNALARQDNYLSNKVVTDRRVEVHGAEAPAQIFVATVEPYPEDVRTFDDTELAAVVENAAQVSILSSRYLGQKINEPNPEELDALFTAWAYSEHRASTTDEEIVQILGAAFGQYCCKSLGMHWVVVTDEDGSAAAVMGIAKNFKGFPYHSIRKRIDSAEHQFFVPVYVTLKHQSVVAKESTNVA